MSLDYIDLIMSAVSRVYIRELSIIVKTPYITIFNDPSEDPYFSLFGLSLDNKLGAMRSIWSRRSNEANDRALATVFTDISRQPAGSRTAGIAYSGSNYSGVICSKNSGYSALGNRGSSRFPSLSYSSDVGTAAHEFGHNLGGPHTHSCFWQRQGQDIIDSCETGATFPRPSEQCLTIDDQRRRLNATIMSYCHTNGSVDLNFHPRLQDRLRENLEDAMIICIKTPTEPVVRLIEPLGDEIYFAGTEIDITFKSANVPQARILYSSNLGEDWLEIGIVNSAVDTSFKWTLPMITSTQSLIRIESTINSDIFDQSLVPFIITDYAIVPEFPKPDDKVGYLTEHRLSWVRQNVGVVKVSLSLDNGNTFTEIATGDYNSINYDFPDGATNEAILLIESVERPDVYIEIPFELGREEVVFNSPLMNDTLSINANTHTIEFGVDFILEEFDILFRKNQTDDWKPLTNFGKKVDLVNNEFVWNFSNDINAGDIGQLRAEIRNSDEVIGESGIFFFDGLSSVIRTFSKAFSINSITPNPVGDQFTLVINNAHDKLVSSNIRIIGTDGKEYKNIRVGFISTGKTPQEIDVQDLPIGTYYLLLESDENKDVQQLKVVR